MDGSGGTAGTAAKTSSKDTSNAPNKTSSGKTGTVSIGLSKEKSNFPTGKSNMVDFGNGDVSGKYKTAEMAVLEFASEYYTTGMYLRLECSATIYKSGQLYYIMNDKIDKPHNSSIRMTTPAGTKLVGYVHTHPNSMEFSDPDIDISVRHNCDAYVVLPSGTVSKYDINIHGSYDIESREGYIQRELSEHERLILVEEYRHVWEEHFGKDGCDKCDSYGLKRTDWPNLYY